MVYYWELSNNRIVIAPGVYTPASLEFKRGDSGSDYLVFLRNGIVVEAPEGFDAEELGITFGVKLPGSPDYLTDTSVFAKQGEGASTKWAFRADWGTDELNEALDIGEETEKGSISVELEFEVIDPSADPERVLSTTTATCTVYRDIVRGDEGAATRASKWKEISTSTYAITAQDAGFTLFFTHADGCAVTVTAGVLSNSREVFLLNRSGGAITFIEGADTTLGIPDGFELEIAKANGWGFLKAGPVADTVMLWALLTPTPEE